MIPFVSLHLGLRVGLDLGFGNPPLFIRTWGVVGTSDRNFGKRHLSSPYTPRASEKCVTFILHRDGPVICHGSEIRGPKG